MRSPMNAFILFFGADFSFLDIRKNKRNASFLRIFFVILYHQNLKRRTDEIQF